MLHPLDSTIFLYSRSKEYVYFNHLSIQQLYMLFLLNISFIRVATIFVLFFLRKSNLSMWFESFQHMWVPFMASSHFQLLYIKDLILHTIGLLIAWLICQLNASTLIVTLVMIHQNQVDDPSKPSRYGTGEFLSGIIPLSLSSRRQKFTIPILRKGHGDAFLPILIPVPGINPYGDPHPRISSSVQHW